MSAVPYILGEVVADKYGNLFRRVDGRTVEWAPRRFDPMEQSGGSGAAGPPGTTDWDGLTNLPAVIAAGDDAHSARVAIDAAPTNGVAYATGVAKDGVTDVSSALGDRISGLTSGSVLQLDAGTYYVPNLRDVEINGSITLRGVPGMTRLLGDGVLADNLYGDTGSATDVMLKLQPGASLRVEDLIIEDAGILIGFESLTDVGDVEVLRCDFTGCGGVLTVVNKSASFLTGMADSKLRDFRNLRVVDCNVRDCELGVAAWGFGGWESATVSGCNFNNVGMVAVWIGSEGVVVGDQARDPDVYQLVQSGVSIHGNVLRHIRPTNYTTSTDDEAVNGIAVWGQGVSIHDNYLEDIDLFDKWDDCEGIYVKARYFDIHNNVLINAGGSEAAIMLKGGGWEASTTLDSSMNGLTLPQTTITVVNTDGFPGTVNDGIGQVSNALIQTSAGWEVIHWTGKTATTLTGVTGGTGTVSTGGVVRGSVHSGGYLEGQSYPGSCRDNTIVFTRTDRQYNGIGIGVPKVVVSGNLIRGATGRAITVFYFCGGGVVSQNRIVDHHGSYVFGVGASNWLFTGNTISNFDGSYTPDVTALYVFWIYAAVDNATVTGVVIKDNHIRSPLKSDGTLSAASAKMRAIAITGVGANGVVDGLVVSGNSGRNLLYGIKVSTGVTVTNLSDLDNDWKNDAGTAPQVDTALATTAAVRRIAGVPAFMTGTVATVVGTAAKTVTLDSPWASVTPVAGSFLLLTFTNGINVANPTLAVNGGTARSLRTPAGASDAYSTLVTAGGLLLLVCDGTNYQMAGCDASYIEISATEIIDTAQTGSRVITGRRAETLMANEATKTRTLTGKTATSLKLSSGHAPASATAAGAAGQIEWDSGFVYICTATNTWKRAAIATW